MPAAVPVHAVLNTSLLITAVCVSAMSPPPLTTSQQDRPRRAARRVAADLPFTGDRAVIRPGPGRVERARQLNADAVSNEQQWAAGSSSARPPPPLSWSQLRAGRARVGPAETSSGGGRPPGHCYGVVTLPEMESQHARRPTVASAAAASSESAVRPRLV